MTPKEERRAARLARKAEQLPMVRRLEDAAEFFAAADAITLDLGKLRREVLRIHSDRNSRKLSLDKRIRVTDLRDVTAQEISNRSRIVEILIEAKKLAGSLETLKEGTLIRAITLNRKVPGSSKTEKRQFLSQAMDQQAPVLYKLYEIIETCEYVLEDIGETRVNLNRITTTFELGTRPDMN